MPRSRSQLVALTVLAAALLVAIVLVLAHRPRVSPPSPAVLPGAGDTAAAAFAGSESGNTVVWAHNLRLRKGSAFSIYIPWVRGEMLPTSHAAPSFDDPTSFVFNVQQGVIRANLGDIGNFLNIPGPTPLPLSNITVTGDGATIRLTGTLHKLLVPIPVEIQGTISPTSTGGVHLHIDKINVLKVPFKRMLGLVDVQIDDLTGKRPMPGVTATGNDLDFNTTTLLPPPHIRGNLTALKIVRPDLLLIYGNARNDQQTEAQWHNFIRFSGGSLGFGHLVMTPAGLTMIDASEEPWFNLDLVNYRAQLTSGVIRTTPDNALEVFMPSLGEQQTHPTAPAISVDWLRDRTREVPTGIVHK